MKQTTRLKYSSLIIPSNRGACRMLSLLLLFLVGCANTPPRPPLYIDTKDSSRSIETIDTRLRVQQSFLHIQPTNQFAKTLIFFPGGNGYGQFVIKEDSIKTFGNFLVRTLGLWNRKYRLVVIDTPSDNAYGMSDYFRNSMEHREDILKVMDILSKRGATEFYLIGTSLGTISAAAIASSGDRRIRGLILTSTHTGKLDLADMSQIKIPVLFVSHRDDSCRFTTSSASHELQQKIRAHNRADYAEITGGTDGIDVCGPFSHHGFFGVEKDAIAVMSGWIESLSEKEK